MDILRKVCYNNKVEIPAVNTHGGDFCFPLAFLHPGGL